MFGIGSANNQVQMKLLEARIIVLEAQIKAIRDDTDRIDKKSRSVAGLVYRKGYKEELPEKEETEESPIFGMEAVPKRK